jgi:hypothetical protein
MNLRRLDVVLLMALVTARVRIDTLADLAAPRPIETIRKIGWLSGLLTEPAWKLLEDWLTDPLSLLMISVVFTLVLMYVVVDVWAGQGERRTGDRRRKIEAEGGSARDAQDANGEVAAFRVKMGLVFAIIGITVVAQSLYLVGLRHVSGPATYTHDGGVIQTEETMKFLLQGKNPYVEDYSKTPMADWGLDFKTALYHYPYLPWTFIFSLPFFVASNALLGWFDERFVYLLLFVATLVLAARLRASQFVRLAVLMVVGLNPIMGSDVIFGQNDSFVLFWLVAALAVAGRREAWARPGALALLALACASKPTAWFFVPFLLMCLLAQRVGESLRFAEDDKGAGELVVVGQEERRNPYALQRREMIRGLLWFAVPFVLIVLPFVLWDPFNFYDDVWAWSAGTSATAYQIRGWGLSNFVLALDWVPSRLTYFPFWLPELVLCVPLFGLMLWRQWRENTLGNAVWHGTVLLLAFAYSSRFLNENYLGFVVALLAVGWGMGEGGRQKHEG